MPGDPSPGDSDPHGPEQAAAVVAEGAEPGPSIGTTASRGFLWANVGVFGRYMSALVMAAVLARVLSPAEYAVMVTLMIVTLYFDNALDLGMGAALVYEQEEGISRRVQVAFTANAGLAVVLAVVAFLIAPVLVGYFGHDGSTAIFRCLPVIVILSGLTTVPWSLFMRGMDFKKRSIVEITRDGTRFVVTVGLAVAGFGDWSIMIGLMATYSVWLVMTWAMVKFRPKPTWDTKIVKELFAYAWRMAGSRLLGILSLNGDYLVVGNRRNDQYPTYYQAFRLPEFVLGAQLNAMSAVLFPMYARIRSEGKVAMRDALYKALKIVGLFSIPVGLGLALVARDAIGVMYGIDSHVAIRTMELLSVTGCIVGLGFATGDLLFAIGRPGVMVRINIVMVPSMLVAMWFVAPYGVIWVALVHLITAVVFTFVRQVVVNRIVDAEVRPVLAALVPGLVVGGCILVCALPVRLLTSAGFVSMLAIMAAGAVGGALAMGLSRAARDQALELVTKLRG